VGRARSCVPKPIVGDLDPAWHACATVSDLIGLDWPLVRLGISHVGGSELTASVPRLPRRRAGSERARSPERELLVLKGRRGERVSF